MIKNLYLLFICISLQTASLAQSASVFGIIADEDSKEPLIGASAVLKGTNKGSIASLDGSFSIKGISAGDYILSFSYVGYEKKEIQITIPEGESKDLGSITMNSTTVGLKEVEVFASYISPDRQTPIAVSTIGSKEIDERFTGSSIARIIDNNPGVYTIQGAGGYGDQEVYIRGFDQSNIAFLVNGIPVNDMENGRMFWSNFAGLSEVTRNLQVQRGLGASKLAISSIGGTVNMITKPSENAEGGRVDYQFGTGSWNQRFSFSYNTGQSSSGWAASFQGARTTTSAPLGGLSSLEQGGVVPGAFTDAWSYYINVSKTINEKHQVSFWAFGAPFNRGSAFIVDDATREEFGLEDGELGNNALGVYNGDLFNARQNRVHKPLMALNHYWDIDSKTSLTTSVYYSHADVFSTQPRDANNTTFFPQRDVDNLAARGVDPELFSLPDNLINWDYLSQLNRSDDRLIQVEFPGGDINTPLSEPGYASRFFLESRHNDHDWIGLISNFRKQIDNLSLMGGLDVRFYKGSHYAEVYDLLGGDFVLNRGSFLGTGITTADAGIVGSATGDFSPSSTVGDEQNKLAPNTLAREGDRINYDYDGFVNWASLFGQAEYTFDKFDIYASLSYTNSSIRRVGNVWNGRDIYNFFSVGESEKRTFNTYSFKGGFNYRYNNRLSVYVNGGYFTRPPFLRNAFADARFSNQYRQGLTTEKIASVEAGLSYRTSLFRVNFNAYYLEWRDRTTQDEFTPDAGQAEDINFTPFTFNGLVSEHQGLELDARYNLTSNLELNGFASLGDWKWANNVSQTFVNEAGEVIEQIDVDIKGLPVGTSAQTTAGLGLHFSGLRSAYIGGRYNFSKDIPIRYNPEDLISRFITREVILDEFPSYHLFSVYAGKYFDISDEISARISVSIQNLFDERYTRFASYFFNQNQRGFGFPRTYTIGLRIDF
ncbi:MAG: TonB-dependent receptor [Bacteroidota bacterium]